MVQCEHCGRVIEIQDLNNALRQPGVETMVDLYKALDLKTFCCMKLLYNADLFEVIVQSLEVQDLYPR